MTETGRGQGGAGLVVSGLSVAYRTPSADVSVLHDVSFRAAPSEITGIAGESGSGKTTSLLTAIGYLPAGAVRLGGKSVLNGLSLFSCSSAELRQVWSTRISYVAQDATAALNPARTVEAHFSEILRLNLKIRRSEVRTRSIELLRNVGLAMPDISLGKYANEFSGGQLQRIAIAMALASKPELLVLDEPTTGLDVTTQAELLTTLTTIIRTGGTAAIYISHDLALLHSVSDRLVVLYAGEVVEGGPTHELVSRPRHPYTRALLDALPSARVARRPAPIAGLPPGRVVLERCSFSNRCTWALSDCLNHHPDLSQVGPDQHVVRCIRQPEIGPLSPSLAGLTHDSEQGRGSQPILRASRLSYRYGTGNKMTVALDDVSLDIYPREVVGLVGESGSGKSTIARVIVGLQAPQSGKLLWEDQPLAAHVARRTRQQRQNIQIVFQNPDSSLNPRHSVKKLVERPIVLFRANLTDAGRREGVLDVLRGVRLGLELGDRYPHELSGGQKQRVAIARALAASPQLVICDEIVSGQDVSAQAAILDLLSEMRRDRRMALLFISHDLAVIRSIAQYVYVIQRGRVVEEGATATIFEQPRHPYTRQLLQSVLERPEDSGQ